MIEPEAQQAQRPRDRRVPPIVPAVNGDAAMLRQAFLNLAINACQAMPNGGTLACRARRRRAAGSRSGSRTPGSASRPSTFEDL